MLRALMLAPPGAGKGTQAELLATRYEVPHLATGDLLRSEVAQETALGREAAAFMERGDLVPDSLVLELVLERITKPTTLDGFVLDGFPRTIDQARLAHEWGTANKRTFHAVIHLEVPRGELVYRLLRRGKEQGRGDDTEDTIRRRLQIYDRETEPLLDFYRGRGILVEIDGTGTVHDVASRIQHQLDPLDLS